MCAMPPNYYVHNQYCYFSACGSCINVHPDSLILKGKNAASMLGQIKATFAINLNRVIQRKIVKQKLKKVCCCQFVHVINDLSVPTNIPTFLNPFLTSRM